MVIAEKTPVEAALLPFTGLYEKLSLPPRISKTIREVRLRAGRPPIAEYDGGRYMAGSGKVTPGQLEEYIKTLCNYSLYSFQKQLREGCIVIKGGHRVGFCGTALTRDGRLDTIKNISSINIRIAREHPGAGEEEAKLAMSDDFRGMLIAGKPLSGKTTVLRDICRLLSRSHKTAAVDTRGEIAACIDSQPQLDVGVNADVLNGYEKFCGIRIAVRVLSPEFVICDEITGEEESVLDCLRFGVKPVMTIHCGTSEEAAESPAALSGCFSHIVFLGDGENIGKVMSISQIDRKGRII